MITRFAPKDYQATIDRIASASVYAPDFNIGVEPYNVTFTLDEIFDDIFYGVNNVKAKTKKPEKLAIIEQVIVKLIEAKTALAANELRSGREALFEADDLFRSVRRA